MAGGSFTIRNYASDDFDKYLRLQVESEQLDPSGRFISAQSLADNLGRPNFRAQQDLFVADSDDKLIGCLGVTIEPGIQRALLDGLVHPLHRRRGIATELVSNGLQRVKAAGIKSAQISLSETNASARRLADRIGFTFIRDFFKMRLDMNSTRMPAAGKNAAASRRLKPGEEILLTEIQNRCFAGTWGFNPNTEEEIAYRLNMHGCSPDDVMLTYLQDILVGYCWTIINAEENALRKQSKGLIHMLGVDPAFRGQEIGKLILLNGLKDLKAKGVDIVELTVDSENQAACSLYASAGFEVFATTQWYEKKIEK
jgi:mycothiol synthase